MGFWSDPERRRWPLWGVMALAFLLVNFHRVEINVVAEQLSRSFDATATELGFLYAAFFYVYSPLQVPAGLLADRLGTRRIATIGLVVMNVGVVWFALADSFVAGLLARGLLGLGGSVLYISTLRFCANWFRAEEFATMTGLTVAASGLGGVLAATPLALAVGVFGWRASLFALGVGGMVLAATVFALVRDTPRKAGLRDIDGAPDVGGPASLATVRENTVRILKEAETWALGGVLFCVLGASFTVLGVWAIPYLVQVYDVGVTRAANYLLVANVGLMVGAPTVGWLSDRLGRRTELVAASAAAFMLAYGLLALPIELPLWVVGVALFCSTFMTGGVPLSFTVVKERHPTEASATATGTINAMGYFGVAVFPPVMGAVLDAFWTGETVEGARIYTPQGYQWAFAIAAAAGFVALCCALWVHRRPK
ncbi:MAG: MFS transporter [Haloarculaceae archaeon]